MSDETDYYREQVDKALSREKLDQLKPGPNEMFENTRRATVWYNEAVWTAAALFLEAADESERFEDTFVLEETREMSVERDEAPDDLTIETDVWRDVMREECPHYHEKVMGIGLSAFQGGNAENVARTLLKEDAE